MLRANAAISGFIENQLHGYRRRNRGNPPTDTLELSSLTLKDFHSVMNIPSKSNQIRIRLSNGRASMHLNIESQEQLYAQR